VPIPASGASSTRLGISYGPSVQESVRSLRTASKVPSLTVSSVRIAHPTEADRDELLAMNAASHEFHGPWAHPPRTAAGFRELRERDARDDCEVFLVRRADDDALVGVFVLSQIFRQGFQSAYLGYYAGAAHAGNGYMRAGLALVLDEAFGPLGLHRVEANIQPGNGASLALARGAGFRREGFSPRYLKIAGRWRDHERFAILAEDWPALRRSRCARG
jgi:[ribosomal protein S5]-alanine N-acetyltransferase